MIRKSGYRFSEKIMLKQKDRAMRGSCIQKSGGHMRIGILILFLIAGLAGGPPASAAEDTGTTQGSRPTPADVAKEPAPPPSVTVIGAKDAHGILGREVRRAANEDMGRVVDVIVDREGNVRAAVIDFGGFLGVGSRKIVVEWSALRFGGVSSKRDSITLELTK